MDLFGFLGGISPWWWIAFAILLGIVEVLTFSFFLIWPALAAVAVGVILWIVPDLAGTWQVLIFAVLSGLFTLAGRDWAVGVAASEKPSGLNDRAAALIGRQAVVVSGFDAGQSGTVEAGGVRWRAELAEAGAAPEAGRIVDVTGSDGMTLIVRPREAPRDSA